MLDKLIGMVITGWNDLEFINLTFGSENVGAELKRGTLYNFRSHKNTTVILFNWISIFLYDQIIFSVADSGNVGH